MSVEPNAATVQIDGGGLKKSIGLTQAVALYVGSVLGSGVLLIPALAADVAGPASLLAWAFMSVLVIPMALTMGLLSARYPDAGGVSTFVRLAYGPVPGALVGWFFFVSVPVGAPIVAVTGAAYLGAALYLSHFSQAVVAALILIVVFFTNYLGMKAAGRLQVAVVSAILLVIILAAAGALPRVDPEHFTPFVPFGWLSVAQAAAIMFWCFIGWEAVTHLSEEFVDPQRDVMRSVIISIVVVGVMYFAVAVATVGTASYGPDKSAASLAVMMRETLGPVAAWVTGITALFICVATANAYVGAASRVGFALARAGAAPRIFGHLHPKHRTPVFSLAVIAFGAGITLWLIAGGVVGLKELIVFPNATFMATYIGGCLAGIRLLEDHKWGRLMAWSAFFATAGVYFFLGWAALVPPVVILLALAFKRLTNGLQRAS
ncbi:MAG: amino acid permease [Eubacteriales bacterium]|nr:amino acid permease [Desulforudis sp.]MDQ7789454.1 amino acid permease [Clostridia bacterium]MDZ4043503.1 amino acid permease [Eubacteriales bacterium]MBV1734613.1 amino acid permease [Desulforudis sp.]MBV1770256.1 amino acid permease [Desulforudis sp.]